MITARRRTSRTRCDDKYSDERTELSVVRLRNVERKGLPHVRREGTKRPMTSVLYLHHVSPLNLYVRGAFDHRPRRVPELRAAGVDVIYCLLRKGDPDVAAAYGEYYRQRPLPDVTSRIPIDEARDVAREVGADLDAGRRVLVHCIGGRNRTGIVTALTLVDRLGVSGADAVARYRAVRGRVGLDNQAYAAWLETIPAGTTLTQDI